MKIDYIYGNPPYDKDLHLRILRFCMNKAHQTAWLHPARWAQSITTKTNYRWLDGKIQDIFLIKDNTKELFEGMDISGNLIITMIGNEGKSLKDYHPLSLRACFPNWELDWKIYNKIMSKMDRSVKDVIKIEPLSKYAVVVSLIGGNGGMNNAMVSKLVTSNQDCVYTNGVAPDGKTFSERRSAGSPDKDFVEHVQFDTFDEANSFLTSLKTPIYTFINSISKVDMHVHPDYLPLLPDYKTMWTEENLIKYFELLPNEVEEIESLVNNPSSYRMC